MNTSAIVRPVLKIAYILPQFPWPSETFALSDIVALRAAGHIVSVYCLKWPFAGDGNLRTVMGVPADLPIHRAGWRTILGAPLALLRHPKLVAYLSGLVVRGHAVHIGEKLVAFLTIPRAIEIAEAIIAEADDVAHAFWGRHPSLVLATLDRLRGEKAPLRSAFIGAYDLVRADFLIDLTLEKAEAVFTHAEANRTFFAVRGRPDVRVVHRGIPLDLGTATAPPRDPAMIVTASSLTSKKNISGVLRAFARLRRVRTDVRLTIFGMGKDEMRLRALARELDLGDSVSFAGYLNRHELFRRLEESAIFLFLSRKPSERLPNVVKEALYAGCNVIASRSDGIEELIPTPELGRIVDADNSAEIDAALLEALAETESAASMRRANARKFIEDNLSTEASMRRYAEIWRAALDERAQ